MSLYWCQYEAIIYQEVKKRTVNKKKKVILTIECGLMNLLKIMYIYDRTLQIFSNEGWN